MRRRTSLAAAAAFSVTWALAACGIPSGKSPEVIGDAPSDFDAASGTTPEEFLPTNDAGETVQNYLKAAAGDAEGRNDRLLAFTEAEQEFSDASSGMDLLADKSITLESEDSVSAVLEVTGSIVGRYLPDGSVLMHSVPRQYAEKFILEREGFSEAWAITEKPEQVVLDYSYFTQSYERAPLYFQAGLKDLLVPDLRWIYRDLEPEAERLLLLGWLIQGPSDFTSFSARNAIPEGASAKSPNVDGTVQVEFAIGEELDGDTVEAIAAQVAWSLGLESEFALVIDGENVREGSLGDWRDWNAIPNELRLQQNGYFIADERVWEYTTDQQVTDTSTDHLWVGFGVDGLRQVAVDAGGQIAAIVAGPDGDVLQVGAVGTTTREVTAELGGDLSDPQWLGADAVLVIDGGMPKAVYLNSGSVQELSVGTDVTSIAIAADGRRLAYVEDGLAWVAAVSVDADGNIQASAPKQIGLDITEVADVAWSSENYLWIAGQRDNEKLFRVALDNSRTEVQDGIGGLVIDQIAANPADPVESTLNRGEPVLVVSGGILYRVQNVGLDAVVADDQQVQATAPFMVLQ
ncbi:LpqB family beta-propeller domain-containing protein [Glycomyces paridis]|uniref:GerMN domain-containing protein n=1 Tax=Glycomyces paridis TaxID=2126555 RepID=A0A4S8PUU3_9ACTN|nr:LpqB family beta-propeller domain-containing protein [Glycomyces paridis]THV32049.1 hypothetical protein E9998_00925 [Glycomyces paridis]